MTYEEFIEKLKQVPGKWFVDTSEGIRMADRGECPLCAVANLEFKTERYYLNYSDAGHNLRINSNLVEKICNAADHEEFNPTFFVKKEALNELLKIRQDLLKACQLPIPS